MKNLTIAAPALAALIMLGLVAGGCVSKSEKAERAKKEVLDSLVLPPDAKLTGTQVTVGDMEMLMLSFGTRETVDVMGGLMQKGITDRGYGLVTTSDGMISYKDKANRVVTVTWYSRDPDLSEFPTVFHVSVQPVPADMKILANQPAAPAAPAAEPPK